MLASLVKQHMAMRLLIYISFLNLCWSDGIKRILLNDPDLLNTQMEQVLRQVQNLSSELVDLKSKYVALQTDNRAKEQEITNLNSKLENEISEMKNKRGGVVFVRWGRKQCPDNDTELVYSGYAGGSYYDHKGAATTTICLPPDPIWGKDSTLTGNYVYGAEFDNDFFGPGTSTGDIPCAVCRSNSASSLLMIPGRNKCYAGWKKQYGGYLMAGLYNDPASTDFSCVDEHPEFIVGGNRNDNGRLLYAVTAKCGSLECPPYVDNKVITCAVCTK